MTQPQLFPLPPSKMYAAESTRAALEEQYAPFMHEALHMGKWVSYVGNKQAPGPRLYPYFEARYPS